MRLATALYRRLLRLLPELARFGTVGAAGYVTQVVVTNLLWWGTELPTLVGQGAGTLLATLVAFLGNRFWTFGHRARTGLMREYARFFVMNGIGIALQLGCVGVAVYVLGFSGPLATNIAGNIIGVGLGTLFRFWSYRTWVFPEHSPVPTPQEEHA
ncbi:putative flippase GtrA [Haloactinospora alba]|uniref:Putative flippase GtrA n=1 Tax=Haloactinospora alba TaxID=405555 RepID=A0A543NEX4_9ACTN|nr:GtrA family protein [Haloactinospora alba]TQN30366.1 putative flippase GtrA [Haloactinospora alba]